MKQKERHETHKLVILPHSSNFFSYYYVETAMLRLPFICETTEFKKREEKLFDMRYAESLSKVFNYQKPLHFVRQKKKS